MNAEPTPGANTGAETAADPDEHTTAAAAEHAVARENRLIAGYAALALAVHFVEAGFPSPLPGIKPGLANVVTLIALQRHGLRIAAWVSLLRVLAGSLLNGSLLGPTFWLSASGATAALAVLALSVPYNRWAGHRRRDDAPDWRVSVLGLSVLAAQAHVAAQTFIAAKLLIPQAALAHLLAPLLAVASLFGLVTGLAAQRIVAALAPPRP